MDPDPQPDQSEPPIINYILSFLLVGLAWGFTTPFIRRAAKDFTEAQERRQRDTATSNNGNVNDTEEQGEEHEMLLEDEEGHEREDGQVRGGEDDDDGGDEDATISSAVPGSLPPQAPSRSAWIKGKAVAIFWTVINLLRTPSYSIPLVLNLTGSVWFFLLVGKHGRSHSCLDVYRFVLYLANVFLLELSLTVPLANSSAFLFTVLGDWYVDRKVIAKETWLGIVLVLGGIALCVHSKNQAGGQ